MRPLSLPVFLLFFLVSVNSLFAQWINTWNSPPANSSTVTGWLNFQQTGDTWDNRYYTLDSLSFQIMTSSYSQTPQYTYSFNDAERLAGIQVYSLGVDLTGDNIVEFYVLSYYGTGTYRQSFKIFDITNGSTVFEQNDLNYYYSYPTIWDIDLNGQYDCSFTRYDFPSGANYIYQVYQTGVVNAAHDPKEIPQRIDLKQNYPNPFNSETRIQYSLAKNSQVNLNIFNVLGQQVKTLVNGTQTSGKYTMSWNGLNDKGTALPSGIYYYELNVEGKRASTQSMILLK